MASDVYNAIAGARHGRRTCRHRKFGRQVQEGHGGSAREKESNDSVGYRVCIIYSLSLDEIGAAH